MDSNIVTETLYDFLLNKNKLYYAKIMRTCGCVRFVDKEPNEDYTGYDYIFKSGFVENYSEELNILYIENRSYLIYEIEESKILTWVCYTEDSYRRKGYMLKLLKKLSDKYPKYHISVDTFDKGLIQLCNDINRNNIFLRDR
ncbi:MAG: hypothetical protein FAF03_08885 [Epsilonproteobacteria bacterium]|nr:hypothetical protein [Campylobacterota bacterium]